MESPRKGTLIHINVRKIFYYFILTEQIIIAGATGGVSSSDSTTMTPFRRYLSTESNNTKKAKQAIGRTQTTDFNNLWEAFNKKK